jgi:hypothetical protein
MRPWLREALVTRSRLASALGIVLPRADQTWLLRACLLDGEPGRDAWHQWQRTHSDVKAAIADDGGAAKHVLPLLFAALRRNGVVLDSSLRPYLMTSFAREAMRNDVYRAVCRSALETLEASRVSVLVLKGAALAEAVYDQPAQRHCHDIDLLVAPEDVGRARCALDTAGFRSTGGSQPFGSFGVRLGHASGLPLELHTELFALPFYRLPATETWKRSRAITIAGVPARVLSPELGLVHVCGHAAYSASRAQLRWVCDAWLIIARELELNWQEVLDIARCARLAVPLFVMLRFLNDALDARIPRVCLGELAEAFERAPAVERDVALFAARSGSRLPLFALLRGMPGGWRTQGQVLQWLLLPSREYVGGAAFGRSSTVRPLRYVSRPIQYAAQTLQASLRSSAR